MGKNHLKPIAAPKSWPLKRKEKKFVLRPASGPHGLDKAVSLNSLLIDFLELAHTKKEATAILHNKKLKVNGIIRTQVEFPVGIMDAVSIDEIKKHYRVILDHHGKIGVKEISEKDAQVRVCRVINKTSVKKKTQLNLSDGTNLLIDKDPYKVGDSVVVDVKNKITDHFKLEKGNAMLLTGGRHMGSSGIIEEIVDKNIIYKVNDADVFETLKKYAFVMGKKKFAIEW